MRGSAPVDRNRSKLGERFSGRPNDPPIGKDIGAESAIETLGGDVPVEHRPFESAASSFPRDPSHSNQQRLAAAATAVFGANEQIFEIETLAPEEGGVVVEVERKTGCDACGVRSPCEERFRDRMLAEERFGK